MWLVGWREKVGRFRSARRRPDVSIGVPLPEETNTRSPDPVSASPTLNRRRLMAPCFTEMTDATPNAGPARAGDATRARSPKWLAQEKLNTLADRLRSQIVTRLSRGAATNAELADALEAPAAKVRYHLRRMREAGFVEVAGKAAEGHSRENLYSILPKKMVLDDAELALIAPSRIDEANARLLRLLFNEAMQVVRGGHLSERPDHSLVRFPILFDEQGFAEASQLHDEVLEQVLQARQRCLARLPVSGEEPTDSLAALFFFKRIATRGVAPNPPGCDSK